MSPLGPCDPFPFSRRTFLRGLGVGTVATGIAPLIDPRRALARPAPSLLRQPAIMGAPVPEQLHVQFGADAARHAAVSWAAAAPVFRPRLRLGRPGDGFGHTIEAEERTYTEALTGQTVMRAGERRHET